MLYHQRLNQAGCSKNIDKNISTEIFQINVVTAYTYSGLAVMRDCVYTKLL